MRVIILMVAANMHVDPEKYITFAYLSPSLC